MSISKSACRVSQGTRAGTRDAVPACPYRANSRKAAPHRGAAHFVLEELPPVGDHGLAIVPGWEPTDDECSSWQAMRVACPGARIKTLPQDADFHVPWPRKLVRSISVVRMLRPSERPCLPAILTMA